MQTRSFKVTLLTVLSMFCAISIGEAFSQTQGAQLFVGAGSGAGPNVSENSAGSTDLILSLTGIYDNRDGSCTAYFGYQSSATTNVTIAAGSNGATKNFFSPGNANRGQGAIFKPGLNKGIVVVNLAATEQVTWSVATAGSVGSRVTASCTSTPQLAAVEPLAQCINAADGGGFSAVMGYRNPNDIEIQIPIGALNKFTPGNADRSQPNKFFKGLNNGAFALSFTNLLEWKLPGKTATISPATTVCVCPSADGKVLRAELDKISEDLSKLATQAVAVLQSAKDSSAKDSSAKEDAIRAKKRSTDNLTAHKALTAKIPDLIKSCPTSPVGCSIVDNEPIIDGLRVQYAESLGIIKRTIARAYFLKTGDTSGNDALVKRAKEQQTKGLAELAKLPRFRTACSGAATPTPTNTPTWTPSPRPTNTTNTPTNTPTWTPSPTPTNTPTTPTNSGSQSFTYTGSTQFYSVVAGCTAPIVRMWGAGGGGQTWSSYTNGGGGGQVTGVIAGLPVNTVLRVTVGSRGQNANTAGGGATFGGGGAGSNIGGSGGGRSELSENNSGVVIFTAGGGGGGAFGGVNATGHGGAGGGTPGIAGGGNSSYVGGGGGTQVAGGAESPGMGTNSGSAQMPAAGSSGTGGAGGKDYSGGGGGGYFGGGGGNFSGGGGGSSYIGGGGYIIASAKTTAGSGTSPGNSSANGYQPGIGVGGSRVDSTTTTPGHGLVVINCFEFNDQTGASRSSTVTSNTITIANATNATVACGTGCTGISINGGAFVAGPVTGVNSGDTLAIRQTSSASDGVATSATVSIGSVNSGAWRVQTPPLNPFSFTNQTNVAMGSTITSNTVTLSGGFANATATCGTGCTGISINGGAFVAGPITGVNSGNTIAIRQTSSATGSTNTTASVTINSTVVTAPWQVTTGVVNPITFNDGLGANTSSTISSNTVTLGGGFSNATATCNAGCAAMSINGGAFVAGPITGVNSGDTLAIQQKSSASAFTTTNAQVTVSDRASGKWLITTFGMFNGLGGVALNTTINSNALTLSGGFSNATATCNSGCTGISINGGAFVAGPVTGINTGDTIAIRQVSSPINNTITSASVTIGAVTSSPWSLLTLSTGTVTITDAAPRPLS